MKSPEKAMTEWVSDEINFADGAISKVWERGDFVEWCQDVRQRPDMVPVLHDAINDFKKEARNAQWTEDQINGWLDSFFDPSRLVRFRSVYEIKEAVKRKKASIKNKEASRS